ncbi:uncharacterized protein LOC144711987 [Wolffia australiana]
MDALLRLHLRAPSSSPPSPLSHLPTTPTRLRLTPIKVKNPFLIPLRRPRGSATCCSASGLSGGSGSKDFRLSLVASPDGRLSDVVWPSAGAFLAMAVLGKLDQMIAPSGLAFTVAPLGAVSAVLFATPAAPGARKYNMFMAQIGCAAFGVLALYLFGPGWLARSTALAASVAFMIITRSIHPPAAGLPIMFIDGAKFHSLHFWYILFPGATGCLILCIIQELVDYLKENCKF